MKQKSMKRALLMSALSMLVCLSMLIGSTFAWFTDSVSSLGNTIQSGTLKVDLVDEYGETLEGKVLKFVDQDENALWEPGCTYQLQPVFVKNKGNLALKYEVVINGIKGDAKLLEAIEWTVTVNGVEKEMTQLTGYLLANQTSDAIVLTGHMKEDAGNEYQDLTVEGISISVFATQFTYEMDSFGDDYDDIALVSDEASLREALASGKSVVLIDDVAVNANTGIVVAAGSKIVMDLNGHTISGVSSVSGANRATFVVKGDLTVVGKGKVSHFHTGTNMEWNNLTAAFSVEGGELTLGEGVIVENGGGTDMAYGVDVNTTLGETVLNVEGATILSVYTGVRLFNNNRTHKAIVNYNSGLIVGENRDIWNQSPSASAVVENAVVNIDAAYTYTTEATSNGGCKYFFEDDMTLVGSADALTAALANGGNIVLVADIAVAEKTFVLPADKAATLTMNGHTVEGTFNVTANGNKNLFEIKGALTVEGEGLITMNTTGNNMGWNAMSCTLYVNGGDLTVNGTTVTNQGGTDMAYAIDTNPWNPSSNEVLDVVLNNAKVESTYRGIRVRDNGPYLVKLVATDSTIDEIWYQVYGTNYSVLVEVVLNNTTCDTSRVDASVLTIN